MWLLEDELEERGLEYIEQEERVPSSSSGIQSLELPGTLQWWGGLYPVGVETMAHSATLQAAVS